jgi:hypothetical protein
MPDFDQMAAGVVKAAQEFITRSLVGVIARLDALEQRIASAPPPRDGRDGLPGIQGEKGKAGRDGIDGKDGLGFEDLVVDYDGERRFALQFLRGAEVKEFAFTLPLVLDRGVWREGHYEKGDAVTWGGSTWIAQRATDAKPDSGNGDFRLAVKKGRDAK